VGCYNGSRYKKDQNHCAKVSPMECGAGLRQRLQKRVTFVLLRCLATRKTGFVTFRFFVLQNEPVFFTPDGVQYRAADAADPDFYSNYLEPHEQPGESGDRFYFNPPGGSDESIYYQHDPYEVSTIMTLIG